MPHGTQARRAVLPWEAATRLMKSVEQPRGRRQVWVCGLRARVVVRTMLSRCVVLLGLCGVVGGCSANNSGEVSQNDSPHASGGASPGAPGDGGGIPGADAGSPPNPVQDAGLPGTDGGLGLPPTIQLETLATETRVESATLRKPIQAPCGGLVGEGRLLRWTPTEDGTLSLSIETDAPHVALVQADCGLLTSTRHCVAEQTSTMLKAPLVAGEPLCITLAFSGEATVQASVIAPLCGDNVLNPTTEQCDFGDTQTGDGCDPGCQFEVPVPGSNSCPGESHTVRDRVTLNGFTVGYSDNTAPTCGAQTGAADRTYLLIPSEDGEMDLALSAAFDAVLSVFTDCDGGGVPRDLLSCSDDPASLATERTRFSAKRLAHYYVVVDGYGPSELGAYSLDVSLTPSAL